MSSLISGSIGALCSVGSGSFVKGGFANDFVRSACTLLSKNAKKSVEKQAKKVFIRTGKKIVKTIFGDLVESTVLSGAAWVADKTGKQYSYYFEKMM